MTFGTILLIILVLMLVGVLPVWTHSYSGNRIPGPVAGWRKMSRRPGMIRRLPGNTRVALRVE